MNNELLKEKGLIVSRISKLDSLEWDISKIINCNNFFKKEESIRVLNEMKDYYEKLEKEHDELLIRKRLLQDKIKDNCNHEILFKEDILNNNYCNCLICRKNFLLKEIDFNCYILTGYRECFTNYYLEQIIYKIASFNQNVLEVFPEYLKQEEKLNNLKIRRREK